MGRVAIVATCTLNQWALDYEGNVQRIVESVAKAKEAGARYICGTELSITGYGCGDHFHERDTEIYAWEALATVMQNPICSDILVNVGLPVMHKNVLYNCNLVFLNREVLLIRPKMRLANDTLCGYKETRWFTEWQKVREVEDYPLPNVISEISGQKTVAFGDGIIATNDTTIGYDICEELWNPESCHIQQCLDGAEIISNGISALEEYDNAEIVYKMVQMASMKSGGCYLLANHKGCDGSQGCYAGEGCIGLNGNIIAHTNVHTLDEVAVVTATIDLEVIRRYKSSIRSRCTQAAKCKPFPRIKVEFSVGDENWWLSGIPPLTPLKPVIPTREEQILMGPACWLWDYLRRSGKNGFLLQMEMEEDSFATAAIVYSMCQMVVDAVEKGNENVRTDVRRIVGKTDYAPNNAKELCGHLLQTLFLKTSSTKDSEDETVSDLARQIGSLHLSVPLEAPLSTVMASLSDFTRLPSALDDEKETVSKNLQSRLSLAYAYYLAEVGATQGKNLIVLGSSNADKCQTGLSIRYGRTYGDINLIGSFRRRDILKFLLFAKERLNLESINQIDFHEDYVEHTSCAFLHHVEGCGPTTMFQRLWYLRKEQQPISEVAEKIKEYFRGYCNFRQNMFGCPLVCYMPAFGPPDDVKPIVYPRSWFLKQPSFDKTVDDIQQMQSQAVGSDCNSK